MTTLQEIENKLKGHKSFCLEINTMRLVNGPISHDASFYLGSQRIFNVTAETLDDLFKEIKKNILTI